MHLRAALPEKLSFFGWPERQHVHLTSYKVVLVFLADQPLDLHQLLAPALNFARSDFVRQMIGRGAFFVGVTEHAQPVKLGGTDEVAEVFKVLLRLAGKADNE